VVQAVHLAATWMFREATQCRLREKGTERVSSNYTVSTPLAPCINLHYFAAHRLITTF